MTSRMQVCVVLLVAVLGTSAMAPAAGKNPPRTSAQLLVDLARDYGLQKRGEQTAADVEHVRALLEAAVRLDPHETLALELLHELAVLAGDADESARWLAGLLRADPQHETGFALWLGAGLDAQQTAEDQAQWLAAVAQTNRPPVQQALLDVARAQVALEQLDFVAARAAADSALLHDPACVEAAALRVDLLPAEATATERLAALLDLLELSPFSLGTVWEIAALLDAHGHADQAARFYAYARTVRGEFGAARPLPGQFMLDAAHNALARGDVDAALELTQEAVIRDPSCAAEGGMLLHYLARQAGKTQLARRVQRQLSERFAALREPAGWPVNEVAQAAWYYCTIEPQPQRALALAEAAAARAPEDVFTRRVLGWAHAVNLEDSAAAATLAPIAADDAYAAALLAGMRLKAGDPAGARALLDALTMRPAAGPAADAIEKIEADLAATTQPTTIPATQPVHTATTRPALKADDLARVLAAFDARVLTLFDQPERYLTAEVQIDDRSPAAGEPWWATFTLRNRAPFPITFGPDAMLNPVFLLSFRVEGDRERTYDALLTVSLDRVRSLAPGAAVSVRRTLDVGPLRRVSRQTPQQLQRVVLSAILAPERAADGTWHPGPVGQQLDTVYFNRIPASTTPAARAARRAALSDRKRGTRFRAITVVAELLGEAQRARRGNLNYRPTAVPTDQLRAALLELLSSESWEVRARTLAAMDVTGLDRGLLDAAEACRTHPQWLVRMMAVRLLARQGPRFAPVAREMAEGDPDALVREFAESYAMRWPAEAAPDGSSADMPDAADAEE
jgi:hypothetical protein